MPLLDSHPVLTCAQAREWERALLIDVDAEWAAMQSAGRAIARAILDDAREVGGFSPAGRLLVLVGKGHNGGDALLAAAELLGRLPEGSVDVLLCFGEAALRPLALRALVELRQRAGTRYLVSEVWQPRYDETAYEVVLDGIFGFQFRPPVDDATAELLRQVNAHPRIRLRAAVDLPSGIGESAAGAAFRADFTYATGILKTPVLAAVNADHVGRVRYLDLGFFRAEGTLPEAAEWVLRPPLLAPLASLRSPLTDKRTYGHLAVVGGSRNYPGAVLLAVRAALRSGVGLVTAFVPDSLAPEYAARHPEVMWVGCPVNRAGGLALGALPLLRDRFARSTALLIGPGLGGDPDTLQLVRELADEAAVPLVFDADALQPEVIEAADGKTFICTPHAGEFKRIHPALYGGEKFLPTAGVLVLKGPLTRVTAGAETYVSLQGGPVLARGGSGDMLAGLIGGLLAQTPDDAMLAAARGVLWHGLAADLLARAHGQVAVENSQLLEQLGPALNSTHARLPDGNAGVHDPERPAEHRPHHA